MLPALAYLLVYNIRLEGDQVDPSRKDISYY